MGDWIDFAEVRSRVSLEDVLLGMYGLGDRLKRSGRKLIGPCPIHAGDSPRAFQADLEKNVWYCHSGCRRGGNVIDVVAALDGISVRDAALKLHATYLAGTSAPQGAAAAPSAAPKVPPAPPGAAQRTVAAQPAARAPPAPRSALSATAAEEPTSTEEEAGNPPIPVRLTLAHDHPHLLKDRGLSLETVTRFGVGYCARGLHRGSIAIPIHDEDGELIAYAGRRLKGADIREHGKYRFPARFKKELVLYNLDRVKAIAATEGVVLVEGFFAVMALSERSVANAVASMGCSLSKAQADLLAECASHVAILYDGNEAGEGGGREALTLLESRGVAATLVALPSGTVPEDLPPRLLRWAISGARLLGLRELAFSIREPKP